MTVGGTLAALLFAAPAAAREGYWQGDVSNSWNTAGNWFVVGAPGDGGFVPQAGGGFNVRAIIGTDSPNGALNSFDAPNGSPVLSGDLPATNASVAGLYLGLRELDFLQSPPAFVNPEPAPGALVGALTITGGTLMNVSTTDASSGADGRIVVGADGRGYLTMTGGTLTGQALVVGGPNFTTDGGTPEELGPSLLDLSGDATLTIANPTPSIGTATFNRRLRIEGPDVNFTATGAIRLNAAGSYTAVITSPTAHSPLTTDASAIIGGSLNVEFSGAGATHSIGQTWDLVDAGVAIAGAFSNLGPGGDVNVTGLASDPPNGAAYRLQRVDSGDRRVLQLVYDRALVLEVDRGTGDLTITNPLGGDIAMDGYTISSTVGSMVTSYHGISGTTPTPPSPNWEKYGLSANALTEVINDPNSSSSEFDLADGTPVPLGVGFDREAVGADVANFGADGEDLVFTYTRPGVESPIRGQVVYSGEKFANNLVLRLNPNTGEAYLKNDSFETLTFDGYAIVSTTGDLSGDEFTGLGGSWVTSPASDDGLTQTNLTGAVTLEADEEVAIGDISESGFTTAAARDGLGLQFILAEPLVPGASGGDYNEDGVVDAADYATWRDNLGASVTLPNENPDAATPGVVDAEDYAFWRAQYGQSGGGGPETEFRLGAVIFDASIGAAPTAAPEPTAAWLLFAALGAIASFGRSAARRGLCAAVALGVAAMITPAAHAVTQGIPLVNYDFEQPGPPDVKAFAFDEMGVPNGAIPGWTFPGPGVETFGHEDRMGDSGAEGGGNPGNEMLLSMLDGVAYQTSGFNVASVPSTQTYRLSFDAHDVFTADVDLSGFEESQNQLEVRLYYVAANGTTRTTIGSPLVISGLPGEWTNYAIDVVGGSAALTPALGRPIGVEFDVTSSDFNPEVAHSWAGVDNVLLQITGVAPGDLDGDGDVDQADYLIVGNNQQQSQLYNAQGELTGDGFVDLNDFRAFKSLYESAAAAGFPVGSLAGAVPEPSAAALAALIGAAAVCVRRRGRSAGTVALAIGLCSTALVAPASAELLFYDPFLVGDNPAEGEYTVGQLTGQNPTVGPTPFFSGPWEERPEGENASNGQVKPAPGLSFLGADAFGGSMGPVPEPETFATDTRVGRYIPTENRLTDTTTGTYYVSWVHNFGTIAEDGDPFDRNAMGHRAVEFWNDGGTVGVDSTISMVIGYLGFQDPFSQQPNRARMVVNVDGQGHQIIENSPASFVDDGATHLIVTKIELSEEAASDTVSIFLDPVSLVEPDLTGATFTGADFTLGAMGIAQFAGAGGTLPTFDELRVATTWEDAVVPFPLPGDTDNDGDVDLDDYENIVSHMNQAVTSALEGDVARADGMQGADGRVTIADYRLWRDNRTDLGAAPEFMGVPEPSALLLLMAAGAACAAPRHRTGNWRAGR